MMGRQRQDRQPLGHGGLGPFRELGCSVFLGRDEAADQALRLGFVGCIEDRPNIGGNRLLQAPGWHIVPGILVQMELAALPDHGWK